MIDTISYTDGDIISQKQRENFMQSLKSAKNSDRQIIKEESENVDEKPSEILLREIGKFF